MSAAPYTPDEEKRYDLPALPDAPFIGAEVATRLNADYAAARARYRVLNPDKTKGDCG